MNQKTDPLFKDASSRDKPGLRTAIKTWLLRHAQVFFYSLGQLWRAPFSLLMTAAVIGIALALPTGLHVLLKNAQQLSGGLDGATKLSAFLVTTANEDTVKKLRTEIQNWPSVSNVDFISREQALVEFKQQSGFGEAITALKENPLPHVLVITPRTPNTPVGLEAMAQQLRGLANIDSVQLDRQWVKRLYAIMAILARGIVVLGSMLGLAVVLVVGNTIRLAIQNRRDEIVVIKLIGGTDAFIRRPFLYTGFWYGLIGGVIALMLVYGALALLAGPIDQLAGLYQTPFILRRLDIGTITALLGASIGLGLAGSWLAVGRHLRDIEPR